MPGIPRSMLNRRVWSCEPYDIERIRFAPLPRGQRPGLHYERSMTRNLVALGAATHMAVVQVAGEKQIGADGREFCHGQVSATDQMFGRVALRQIERMMCHHDLRQRRMRWDGGEL